MAAFNERGMHARLDFSVVVFADCKEFQRVAEFLPGVYVVHGNLRDALAIHPLYGHFFVIGQRGQNRQFIRRVKAFDVGCRIEFGISEFLRGFQRVFVRRAVFAHRR